MSAKKFSLHFHVYHENFICFEFTITKAIVLRYFFDDINQLQDLRLYFNYFPTAFFRDCFDC